MCLLQVIMSDFQRTLKTTTSEEVKQAAVFVVLDRTSKADIGGKITKSELKRQVLETTKTRPLWRNQTWILWTRRWNIWRNCSLFAFTLVGLPQSLSRSADAIVCFLQVVASDFERIIKTTTAEEKQDAELLVFHRTTRTTQTVEQKNTRCMSVTLSKVCHRCL